MRGYHVIEVDTCDGRDALILFWESSIEELFAPAQTFLLVKMKVQTDKQSHGLGSQTIMYCKTRMTFQGLWLKEPRHSENVLVKKCFFYGSTCQDVLLSAIKML